MQNRFSVELNCDQRLVLEYQFQLNDKLYIWVLTEHQKWISISNSNLYIPVKNKKEP